jgi:hypothetical protein
MPTRIIEIEHVQNHTYPRLKLRETYELDIAPYAALSYCWGDDGQPVKTTSGNIHQHLTRLNYTDLPRTIQDAIIVTCKLGIRYLWIDSLCIMQNDNRDKSYEISQMPFIYSQATVTISACRAASVQEGFLHDRSQLDTNSRFPSLRFPYRCENGEITSIALVPEVREGLVEPLSVRGWALQERLLSSRVIEYGSSQTRWICLHEGGTQTDGLRRGADEGDMVFRKALDVIQRDGRSFGGPQVEDISGISALERWRDILERYTKRKLTLSTDRLPAISGVATRFSRILADEYCAGLWKSALTTELLWEVVDKENLASRPAQYQGPSWSWAAVNSSITFLSLEPSNSVDDHFSVVGVNIQPVKSDLDKFAAKFGAVESGRLVLTGKLADGLWMHRPTFSQWTVRRRGNWGDRYLSISTRPDAIEEEFDKVVNACIPVCLLKILEGKTEAGGPPQRRPPMGVVLKRNKEDEYTRLGIFEFALKGAGLYDAGSAEFGRYQEQVAWLNNCETQTITIV